MKLFLNLKELIEATHQQILAKSLTSDFKVGRKRLPVYRSFNRTGIEKLNRSCYCFGLIGDYNIYCICFQKKFQKPVKFMEIWNNFFGCTFPRRFNSNREFSQFWAILQYWNYSSDCCSSSYNPWFFRARYNSYFWQDKRKYIEEGNGAIRGYCKLELKPDFGQVQFKQLWLWNLLWQPFTFLEEKPLKPFSLALIIGINFRSIFFQYL